MNIDRGEVIWADGEPEPLPCVVCGRDMNGDDLVVIGFSLDEAGYEIADPEAELLLCDGCLGWSRRTVLTTPEDQ